LFLAGTVESEIMISRSALAHIYDNVKDSRDQSIGRIRQERSAWPAPRAQRSHSNQTFYFL
jgi:hypothetical protein